MIPAKLDLTVYQGSDFLRTFTYKNNAGSVVDISDYDVRMQIRDAASTSGTVLKEINVDNAGVDGGSVGTALGATGVFRIVMTAAQTLLLNFTYAYYDIRIYHDTGGTDVIAYGMVDLIKGITVEDNELVTYASPIMSFRMGGGEIISGYDYLSISLPTNITIYKVYIQATNNSVGGSEIQIRTAEAGGGNYIDINVANGESSGVWSYDDAGQSALVINRNLGHKLVIRCGLGGQLNNVDVIIWPQV